ncbi:recQ-mediated genome instability protein 1 [Pristis pectinata]|uniref:recQ-mediated genome instability protein 1 n=1 Tax=Pristis pectinata TaxID=685728 RepID=UPI00223CC67B|nr:recQ-mediated genome instability protein 1 [Pristis pectinata]XP_051875389.1 recQ-mediated genome instability protein 1 [Pristis pectinata]XP_051875390.1 recQ-mediated genome instability protein 1 [Pristis pectinata]
MISARVETWLEATWHLKVPSHWLQACLEWIQQENQGTNLTQALINKQVFEQWLLTDLRDLEHQILPDGISEMQKSELSGFYCLQVDSLVDVSQPAYSQLQKIRGKDTTNEQVTSTQISQRSWEAKPTRMLMLQLTDGVQGLQAMEYQPIPALHCNLSPGTKILLLGNIACRLGVLLLKPENVRVLGGEVETLVKENSQERILARLIGESDDAAITKMNSNDQPTVERTNGMPPLPEPVDDELLAGFDDDDDLFLDPDIDSESGYGTKIGTSSSVSDCTQHPTSALNNRWQHREWQSSEMSREFQSENKELQDNNDEDFDEFPLDELDDDLFNAEIEPSGEINESSKSHVLLAEELQISKKRCVETVGVSGKSSPCREQSVKAVDNSSDQRLQSHLKHLTNDKYTENAEECSMLSNLNTQESHNLLRKSGINSMERNINILTMERACDTSDNRPIHATNFENVCVTSEVITSSSSNGGSFKQTYVKIGSSEGRKYHSGSIELKSPPFTYLKILLDKKPDVITVVQIKGFIVTLLDKLTSSSGLWSIRARISDGTAYMDMELGDDILRNLIGFSVGEMRASIKCPNKQKEVTVGLQKCQQELVDLCCLMMIEFNPTRTTARVVSLHEVSVEDLQALKHRVHEERFVLDD